MNKGKATAFFIRRQKPRSGSVGLIFAGVLFALLLAFSSFLKFSVSRKYVTKKLTKVLLAREFSLSLATLACHQLRYEEIHNEAGLLFNELSQPISAMKSERSDKISFSQSLKPTLDAIINANSELNNLSYSVGWLVAKEDFKPGLSAYQREKIGLIRIPIEISYSLPGSNLMSSESYLYTVDVKVLANLVPVLSKFTLYVQDALAGESSERFNTVLTDKSGNNKGSSFRPWVLNNGANDIAEIPDRFSEIVNSTRGLIYLGGGAVILANARGWGTPGDFAEGFHLYKEGRGAALYTVAWLGTTALINWEAGLCDDTSDEDCQLRYDMVKEGFEKEEKVNSCFRLLGTDVKRSPTIVFGDVFVRTLCSRIFKSSAEAFGFLPYAKTQASFDKYKKGDDPKMDISFFISQVGDISLEYYNNNYASRIWDLPYNRVLGYILTNHLVPDPATEGQIPKTDTIHDFISGMAIGTKTTHQVPAPFDKILATGTSLTSMQQFLTGMEIPGRRAAYNIEVRPNETLLKALEREGFLKDGKLDLNGWLFVKSSAPLAITSPLVLISHGGIVLEKGNIDVKAVVSSVDDKFILNLVTLSGDISIASSVNGKVNMGLTANGQVKIEGQAGGDVPTIYGNVAMQKIAAGSLANSVARGADINYFDKLSALPFQTAEAGSEKPILMYAIDLHPKLIQ